MRKKLADDQQRTEYRRCSKLKTRSGIPDLLTQVGGNNKSDTFTKTDQEKADTFSKQFSSVFTNEPDSNDMPYFE